ncbi:Protein unc-50 [Mortierella sp. AM989]|nr:Protein unc-50 [Mortierella sp. AM989]
MLHRYRNIHYHKQTKNQWARDDPAFMVILSGLLGFSAIAWGLVYGHGMMGILKMVLYMVFVDFVVIGVVVATVCWTIANRLLARASVYSTDQSVEWQYAFDIHCNAFMPVIMILYIIQMVFMGILVKDFWICTVLGNTLYMAAVVYYCYITFLGYNALPFVKHPEMFLYPITIFLIIFVITLILGINISSKWQCDLGEVLVITRMNPIPGGVTVVEPKKTKKTSFYELSQLHFPFLGILNQPLNSDIMGQVNSTEALGNHSATSSSQPTLPSSTPPSTSSTASPIPSVEDMRNITSRILASTDDALKIIRENIPTIELPTSFSANSTPISSVNLEEVEAAAASAASMTDGLGFATDLGPVVIAAMDDEKVFVFRSFGSNGKPSSEVSVADLIKIHYQLSVDWVKGNTKTFTLGILAFGAAVVVGTVAISFIRSYCQNQRRLRVLKAKDGAKREIVVITNVATLEGTVLALSLDQAGFIVFVGVPNQQRADEVVEWGRTDIHPVIVDTKKDNSVEDLVRAVSNFLDQHNSALLGGSPISSSSSVIYEEELSSSTANIRFISPEHSLRSVGEAEAKRRHHGKTDSPLFRLAAVILNPYSVTIGPIENVNLELWRQSIDTNITGTVVATQKFLPLLRRTLALDTPRRSPRLIIITSAITGSIGFPYQSSICASHHAIEAIVDSLRREIRPQGIEVICLRLGITDRSFRSDSKGHTGSSGLLNVLNPTQLLKASFKAASTTSALCEVTYDAITSRKPSSYLTIGKSSLSYSFVGWAVPRSIVDWSIKGKSVKIYSTSEAKVASASEELEE